MFSKFLGIILLAAYAAGIVFLVGLGYFVGAFSVSFSTNLCYSSAISTISDQAETAIRSNQVQRVNNFLVALHKLPLNGYETSCDAVLDALKKAEINEVSDTYKNYNEFISSIQKFPYTANDVQKQKIIGHYDKLVTGMTKEQVASLLGVPDFSDLNFGPKGPDMHLLGSAWTYVLSKKSDGLNLNDQELFISYDKSNRLKWAVPRNLGSLQEIGSPQASSPYSLP